MKNRKSLGQHWLKNRAILDEIAELAAPAPPSDPSLPLPDMPCLEIGPGLGTLTSSLFKHFSRIIAVEYDADLARNLPNSFPGKNLTVKHQNFLDFDLSTIAEPYIVAGNIPYYITSPIIAKLLTAANRPQKIVLLVQKEVAMRLAATTGQHTYLSIFTQNYATVSLGPIVPKSEFTPPPKVDSSVVIFTTLHASTLSPAALKLAKTGFSNPRKKLSKNLPYSREAVEQALAALNVRPDARPADLSIKNWKSLAKILNLG